MPRAAHLGASASQRAAHEKAVTNEAKHVNDGREKYLQQLRVHRGTVGLYSRPEPYAGPRQFELYPPLVAEQMAAGTVLRGRPPVPFIVRRDESIIRPFGGFRVYWRDIEVGRTLSWPTYENCRRLRDIYRASASPDERRKLTLEVVT